jgi:omega-6 fatty acid desaturase (delta-12 desaturase)
VTMGGGGRMSLPGRNDIMERAPCAKPPFTFGEEQKSIPPHCFHRSLLRSFSYLAFDLVIIALLLYLTTFYFTMSGHSGMGSLAWVLGS